MGFNTTFVLDLVEFATYVQSSQEQPGLGGCFFVVQRALKWRFNDISANYKIHVF